MITENINYGVADPWALKATEKTTANSKLNNGFKLRTACGNGHQYVEGSWRFRPSDNTRECLVCRDQYKGKKREQYEKRKKVTKFQKSTRINLDYLKLKPIQSEKSDILNYALDEVEGLVPCQVPEIRDGKKFFPHADFDERIPPTKEEAENMCSLCPVRQQCEDYALSLKFDKNVSIVMGGLLFVEGKRQ